MAPVLAIAGMVARTVGGDGPSTPLERFSKPIVTGPNRIPSFTKEGRMTDMKLWRGRKERKEWARRLQSEDPGLEVVHPHAAGIDVGNGMHYVAIRPDRDPQPVRRLECFTADLHRLADWLRSCGVKTAAMQSTGVHWIPIYEILEERGILVY